MPWIDPRLSNHLSVLLWEPDRSVEITMEARGLAMSEEAEDLFIFLKICRFIAERKTPPSDFTPKKLRFSLDYSESDFHIYSGKENAYRWRELDMAVDRAEVRLASRSESSRSTEKRGGRGTEEERKFVELCSANRRMRSRRRRRAEVCFLWDYLDSLSLEGRLSRLDDVLPPPHDGDGGAVEAELRGDLEADAGAASGDERHLPLQHLRPERRRHLLPPSRPPLSDHFFQYCRRDI